MTDLIETAPQMDLALPDMAPLVEAVRDYHALSSPLCQRREQRKAAHTSRQGLRAALPRTSIAPLVLAVEGAHPHAVRALQAFSSAGAWEDAALLLQHGKEVEQELGEDDGVLLVDGRDCPQQGGQAAGVQRQDGGALGTRATCQAGVFGGSVGTHGSTVRDRRLSLPTEWVMDDAYAARRTPGGMPPAMTFHPKPALAEAMRTKVGQPPSLRCRWVVADEAWGGNPGFLDGVARLGLGYCTAVPHTTRVWGERRRCRWRGGRARRSRQAARDLWWRSVRPCGWAPSETPGPVLRSGWSCAGPSTRER